MFIAILTFIQERYNQNKMGILSHAKHIESQMEMWFITFVELSNKDVAIFIRVSTRNQNERDIPFFSENEATAVYSLVSFLHNVRV
jgi:hypothetical protein